MSAWKETELGPIPADWSLVSVRDLVDEGVIDKPLDGNHGELHPKGSDFVSDGIPFVMATDINSGKIDLTHCKFITKKQADSLSKGFAIAGDVLLTHKGTLGRTAIVGEIKTPYVMLTPQVTYYRVINGNRLHNRFLKYYFDSPFFQDTLINHGDSGSTRAYVGITAQRELPVIIPGKIDEQRSIASVLSSLDDKIDLLHRQNKTLEAMAEALFRQWFVEEAQEDWEEGRLADYADRVKVNITPANAPMQCFSHYSLPAFDEGMRPAMELGSEILSNKYCVEPWTILVSKLNPRFPRIWPIGEKPGNLAICSSEFQAFRPRNAKLYGFIYYWLKSKDAIEELSMAASGTSGSHQRVRPEDIQNIGIRTSSLARAADYSEMVMPGIERLLANIEQAHTLEKLRDTLLPKLMSGEVRVEI